MRPSSFHFFLDPFNLSNVLFTGYLTRSKILIENNTLVLSKSAFLSEWNFFSKHISISSFSASDISLTTHAFLTDKLGITTSIYLKMPFKFCRDIFVAVNEHF